MGKPRCRQHLLVIISVLLFIITLGLGIVLTVFLYKEASSENVCLTPGCVQAASNLLKYMDRIADPCEDFYQFACGGFLESTIIPPHKTGVTSFSSLSDKLRQQLTTIVEEADQSSKLMALVKKSYHLCMNTSEAEINGMHNLLQFLKNLGGWPLLEGDSWNEGTFDWKDVMYELRKVGHGTSYFIGFDVSTAKEDSTKRIISIEEPDMIMGRTELLKSLENKDIREYYEYMVDISVLFGIDGARAREEIKQSLGFATALANLTLPSGQPQNVTASTTIAELQNEFPFIPWLEYIINILDVPGINITEDEVVYLSAPQFLKGVGPLLHRTPKRVLANYITNGVVLNYVTTLPKRFRNRQEEYYKRLFGFEQALPISKSCLSNVISVAPFAVSAAYVRKHFDANSKKQAEEIVQNIKGAFYEILKNNNWMDEKTRAQALKKADAITGNVGYPSKLLDDKAVEKLYSNLEIDLSSQIKQRQSSNLFNMNEAYKKLREPVDKRDWTTQGSPIDVGTYLEHKLNRIHVPAATLQGVFFRADRPHCMNYGAIGSIVGHVITHDFDDLGNQLDETGYAENWREGEAEERFMDKAQCFVHQYENFSFSEMGLMLNGINTQGENIADTGGVKAAYLAYQSWVARHGQEPRLPGFDFTPSQLFWVSAASIHCSKLTYEAFKSSISGVYPEAKFRVRSLSNNRFFSQDFECPWGSPMNPYTKCEIW